MTDVATRIAGRYRVDARLGGGGMADVFDAFDEHLERPVAVKLLRGIDDAAAARRFAEEIRLTARVNHPNIVALYDAGEHDGSPYLVLERVTGGTLATEMANGPMEPRRVAAIGEQIASALSHSHAAGIVHRDVKPSNILLAADGSVRLADFGIAVTATATRLTVAGTVAGSAGYVSPEQVLGSGVGAPSDIYALGLVLLECLVGAPPWSGTTVEVALARLTSDPAVPDDLPEGWPTLLRAMTAREGAERPSIDLVGYALSRLAIDRDYEQHLFLPASPPQDARIPAVAGGSLVVLLLAAFLVLTTKVTPPDIAAADPVIAQAPISVPAADSLLRKAVTDATAELPTNRAPQRAEKPAAKKAKKNTAARNARTVTAAQPRAAATAQATTSSRATAQAAAAPAPKTSDRKRTATTDRQPTRKSDDVAAKRTTNVSDTGSATDAVQTTTRTSTSTSNVKLTGLDKADSQRLRKKAAKARLEMNRLQKLKLRALQFDSRHLRN